MPGTIETKASQLSKVLRSYFALVYVAVFSTMAMFWHFAQAESIQVMLEKNKITFPFSGGDFFRYTIHDSSDRPLPRSAKPALIEQYQKRIDEVVSESMRFVK